MVTGRWKQKFTAVNSHSDGPAKQTYFMTHINHYQEITEDLAKAVKLIQSYGFTIRNQTVLLNHVNDNYKTLAETFRRMFWVGVHPYYLLQCHKEKGIVHFITPIQVGKIYMKHLQGWISGITVPRYASNIEGGGGKVLLMPSGHDTLNTSNDIEAEISKSHATISTWDHRKIKGYEALGRATKEEFEAAENIMTDFIGRKGVFLPKVILVDEEGRHIATTNKTKLPRLDLIKKTMLLNYQTDERNVLITNPALIEDELNSKFYVSDWSPANKTKAVKMKGA